MSLNAFKEPMTLVSRCRPVSCTGSPPRIRQRLSPSSRRTLVNSSKLLAALDAAELRSSPNPKSDLEHNSIENDVGSEDSSIEILGPFPRPGNNSTWNESRSISVYPFPSHFVQDGPAVPASETTRTNAKSASRVERKTAAANGVASTSMAAPMTIGTNPTLQSTTVQFKANTESNTSTIPIYSYQDYSPAPITVYTQHEDEANDLVQTLRGPLGFDLEWRVIWRQGAGERRTALVQLCDERIILLVQVSSMKRFPQKVKEIIESPDVPKLGANIHNDGKKLFRDFGICAQNLVELGALGRQADPPFAAIYKRAVVSLANVVQYYERKTLQKGKERTGNWEAKLTEKMIDYAANDAHCSLMVYKKLMAIVAENKVKLAPATYTSHVTKPKISTTAALATSAASATYSMEQTTNLPSVITRLSELSIPNANTVPALHLNQDNRPRPQHMRAYKMWHLHQRPLHAMCAELTSRGEPLKESTVISYVVMALQVDKQLPFDMNRLRELVQMEASSWQRHRGWIACASAEGRGMIA